jgi:hypothetical protein
VQKLLAEIRRGVRSLADVARATDNPHGAVLLHRPAGVLFASDLTPGLRAAGEQAALDAVERGSCVVDQSSIHLMNLVPADDRRRIKAVLRDLIAASAVVNDATRTRERMRGLSVATYTATLNADGTIERTILNATEQALLREQADRLEDSAAAMNVDTHSNSEEPDEAGLELALRRELPLWCDDVATRQNARARRIPTFGLIDLVTVLRSREPHFETSDLQLKLANEYVVDLPLNADDIVTLAASHDWKPGPAHTAISRPGWWKYHGNAWRETWLSVATSARQNSEEALTDLTRAALMGAIESVSPGAATQRYQQLVVLALVSCHRANQPTPTNFLDDLAEPAADHLPPRPAFVLQALIDELTQRSILDAIDAARRLLPGVDMP